MIIDNKDGVKKIDSILERLIQERGLDPKLLETEGTGGLEGCRWCADCSLYSAGVAGRWAVDGLCVKLGLGYGAVASEAASDF